MYLIVTSALLQPAGIALAEGNEFQPFTIPNPNPSSWDEIKKVVVEGESNDPQESIHANLEEAMCGGFDFDMYVNGVFNQPETFTIGETEYNTNPNQGLIPVVTGVPGRDTVSAYNNLLSGLGERREEGGTAEDIEYSDAAQRRVKTGTFSGFDYPVETCGLATLCRPPNHPDERQGPPGGYRNANNRDRPAFFCEHPCQRPLDDPGKPAGWDETDSTSVQCGNQQPYAPAEDQVKYSCGGKETLGPGEDFCGELNENGQLAGLCQDINNWVYIQWRKLVHVCVEGDPIAGYYPVPIYRYIKGQCGFPAEIENSEDTQNRRDDEWKEVGVFECCSDDPFPGGKQYSFTERGMSCIPCNGEECRLNPQTNEVILNDTWLDPFPTDLPSACSLGIPPDPAFVDAVLAIFEQEESPGVNVGPWPDPDQNLRKQVQEREYISFFREYTNATYERDSLDEYVPEDDHKKENIPVACYGMYDLAPEDAKTEQTDAEDKRCTIAAYYEADDGDGDEVNFWKMRDTQRGKANLKPDVSDDPFNDPIREFDEEEDVWFPELSDAFSMLNEKVFEERFNNDFSFVLLAPDSARQRATVQLDKDRKLSSGALIRSFDDTITIDEDSTKERRTMVEWWQGVETELHKNFTPPTVRMLLPTTWSIDINPLDPIYTPPLAPDEDERSPDPRSETIEVQIQAGENMLGEIAAFMERNLLLRLESEPIPVVVPMANPTELRAWAQGWDAWAMKQEANDLPGADKARQVSAQLLHYADQADDVRKLRGELAKYATKLLHEQSKMHTKIAQWVTDNMDAYQEYLLLDWGINALQNTYQVVQNEWRSTDDSEAFPWCRNDRFTAPIYSMLDPWLPGREIEGDVTGGFGPCLNGGDCSALFADYNNCISLISEKRDENPDAWPSDAVCDQYFPMPPALPQLPDNERDADIVIDFTAFKEAQKTVSLPVLKPVQIRMDFNRVRPPGLEQDTEPNYPEFINLGSPADLPELPDSISNEVLDSIPEAVIPSGEDFDLFKEPSVLAESEDDPDDQLPKIEMPQLDILGLSRFLDETQELIEGMTEEYDLFWQSLIIEPCEGGSNGNDCVRPKTEQDCILPHDDPKGKCVHFEADLKERFQRIGARPAIFLFEDFHSKGAFRKPYIMGQEYCEREDWACQLLNKYRRKPREGWQLFITDEYDPTELLQDIRSKIREATDNIIEDAENRFLFDIEQDQMYENFRIPQGERIEKYREPFDVNASSSSSSPTR